MIFKKTLFVLTLIAIYVIAKVSASGIDTQKQPVKKKGLKKTSVLTLSDTASQVGDVSVEGESIVVTASSEEQPVPLVNKQLEELIEQEKYDEIEKLGENINDEEFLEQLCLLIVSSVHYKGLYECLKRRGMGVGFFVHGRMEVVKEVIVGIKGYDTEEYIDNGDLETAIPLALEEGSHERVIDLLVARQARTAEEDEQRKRRGSPTGFEGFMGQFFDNLAPWEDSKSLKRFMTLKEEFNGKHSTVYETVCQELVYCLRYKLRDPNGRKLMADLVAQPALLTLTAFVGGFLWATIDAIRPDFIIYGWREAIQEGLKEEYLEGGRDLWKAIMDKYPGEFSSDYPPSNDVLDVVLKKFKTKKELEQEWLAENFPGFLDKVRKEVTVLVPVVLVEIIAEYVRPTWLDIE